MTAKRKYDAQTVQIDKNPGQEKLTLRLLLEQLEFDESRYDRAKLTSLVNMLANECLDIRQEFLLLGGLNKIACAFAGAPVMQPNRPRHWHSSSTTTFAAVKLGAFATTHVHNRVWQQCREGWPCAGTYHLA